MNIQHPLTPDQLSAADGFGMFLLDPTAKEFVISGAAGVGKTTLLKYLTESAFLDNISTLAGRPLPDLDWHFTATTNKAADVLNSVGFKDSRTIHSLLGLKVTNDFNSGVTRIERTAKSPIISNALIVIDECSMVDTILRRLINEGTYNCKLLYVGDHCQMAPITETISPVFEFNTTAVINEIVRSKNSPTITALCKALRNTVETGEFFTIPESPGSIDYLDPAQAETAIQDAFVLNTGTHDRILHYRNEQVLAMNHWIRDKRGLPPEFMKGEFLVSNSATHAQTTVDGKRYMLSIEQEIEVLDVSAVEMMDMKAFNVDTHIATYVIETQFGGFRVAKHPHELKACLAHLSKQKAWYQFFQLKEAFADLRMREACTVYKAQGSTYHTTFIDLTDIGRCNNPAQVARMLYVACSRATDRICFIGRLPLKYGG